MKYKPEIYMLGAIPVEIDLDVNRSRPIIVTLWLCAEQQCNDAM